MLSYTIVALLQRSSIPPLSDVLAEIRAQCVQFAAVVLQGLLSEEDLPHTSPLLGPVLLLNQSLPRGFLPELVARTHANHELFNKVGKHFLHLSEYETTLHVRFPFPIMILSFQGNTCTKHVYHHVQL